MKNFLIKREIKEENRKESSNKKVKNFFAYLVMVVVDLVDQPYFFDRAAMSLGIGEIVDLVIGGAILTRTNITIGFFRLFL